MAIACQAVLPILRPKLLDMLRRRTRLVHARTGEIISVGSLVARHTGQDLSYKDLDSGELKKILEGQPLKIPAAPAPRRAGPAPSLREWHWFVSGSDSCPSLYNDLHSTPKYCIDGQAVPRNKIRQAFVHVSAPHNCGMIGFQEKIYEQNLLDRSNNDPCAFSMRIE